MPVPAALNTAAEPADQNGWFTIEWSINWIKLPSRCKLRKNQWLLSPDSFFSSALKFSPISITLNSGKKSNLLKKTRKQKKYN